jgi:hypothetical protein
MNLISCLGDTFQLSYVAKHRDHAGGHASEKLGIDKIFVFEAKAPTFSRGVSQILDLRVVVANTGTHQFEIVEPAGGPTLIYTDSKELDRQALQLHQVSKVVIETHAVWHETLAKLPEDGDEFVHNSELAPDEDPTATFAYVDNRASLGHFT